MNDPEMFFQTLQTMIIVGIILAAIAIVGRWRVFSKTRRPPWYAFVPYLSQYTLYELCGGKQFALVGISIFFLESMFARSNFGDGAGSLLSKLITIVSLGFSALMCYKLAKSFGKGILFAVGLFFLSPVFMLILGFDESYYLGVNGDGDFGMFDAFTARRQQPKYERPKEEKMETFRSSSDDDFATIGGTQPYRPQGGTQSSVNLNKESDENNTFRTQNTGFIAQGGRQSTGFVAQGSRQNTGSTAQGGSNYSAAYNPFEKSNNDTSPVIKPSDDSTNYGRSLLSDSFGKYSSSESNTNYSSNYSSNSFGKYSSSESNTNYKDKYSIDSVGKYSSSESNTNYSSNFSADSFGKYSSSESNTNYKDKYSIDSVGKYSSSESNTNYSSDFSADSFGKYSSSESNTNYKDKYSSDSFGKYSS